MIYYYDVMNTEVFITASLTTTKVEAAENKISIMIKGYGWC